MRIKVDIDLTPEEARRFFGLPDVSPLHEEVVESVRRRMHEGWEGYDPASMLRAWSQTDFPGLEPFQRAFWEALREAGRGGGKDD